LTRRLSSGHCPRRLSAARMPEPRGQRRSLRGVNFHGTRTRAAPLCSQLDLINGKFRLKCAFFEGSEPGLFKGGFHEGENESACRLGPKARTPFVVRPQIRRTETFVVAKRVERERPGGLGNQQQSTSWRSSAPHLARKALISARLPLERGLRRARDAGVDWPAVRGRAGSLTRFAGCRPMAVA
jgi:hypothetical protein